MRNKLVSFFHRDREFLNRALRLMLLISGFYMFASGMFSPIYAIFVEEIGGSITTASNAWAVFWLTAGILTFLVGRWENKIKETELGVMWSQFILGIAYLMYYFTHGVTMLYLTEVMLGVGSAFFWPAFHAVYGKHVNSRQSAWQWSIYDGMGYVVPAVAAALGGWLVKFYGFGTVFIVMAILSWACGAFILFLPRKAL